MHVLCQLSCPPPPPESGASYDPCLFLPSSADPTLPPLCITSHSTWCPAVYLQWQGKCRNCNEFGTVVEQVIQPPPTSTAAHVQALLQGSSSSSSAGGRRTARSTSNTSGWSAPAAAVAPPAGVSDDFADAAADPYNTIGPDYDAGFGSDDDDTAFGDTGPAGPWASSSSSRLAGLAQLAQSGAWVSGGQGGGGGRHVPRRLSDMMFEARDLRVPLYGVTGEEVSTPVPVYCEMCCVLC
jgi:hypothetical protein